MEERPASDLTQSDLLHALSPYDELNLGPSAFKARVLPLSYTPRHSFINFFSDYLMCISVQPVRMYAYYMSVCCPQRTEKGLRALGIGVTNGCEPPHGCWEPNPSPL